MSHLPPQDPKPSFVDFIMLLSARQGMPLDRAQVERTLKMTAEAMIYKLHPHRDAVLWGQLHDLLRELNK